MSAHQLTHVDSASQRNFHVPHDSVQQHLPDKQRTRPPGASRLYPRQRHNPATPHSWRDTHTAESSECLLSTALGIVPPSDQLQDDWQWQYHDDWNHMIPASAAIDQSRYFAPVTSYHARGRRPAHNWQSPDHAEWSDGQFCSGHGYGGQQWNQVSEWTPVVSRGQHRHRQRFRHRRTHHY